MVTVGDGDECEMSRHAYNVPDTKTDQCDAYLVCEQGRLRRELCEDGLVYHPRDNLCDMPQRVDCTGRERLQPPKGEVFVVHVNDIAC